MHRNLEKHALRIFRDVMAMQMYICSRQGKDCVRGNGITERVSLSCMLRAKHLTSTKTDKIGYMFCAFQNIRQ